MQSAERLSVDAWAGDKYSLAHHWLVLLLPVNLYLWSDECYNRLGISLRAHHEQLVAHMEYGVSVRNAYVAFVQDARANEVTVQEIMHLQQCLSLKIGVGHLDVHLVRLNVCVLAGLTLKVFLLLVQFYLAYISHENGRTNDAYYAERISTCVSAGYLRQVAVAENIVHRLVGSTQTRRVCDGAIERSHHHWQVVRVAGVEENKVACEHHSDVKHNACCCQSVEFHSRGSKTLEKAGAHLHTNHEDKEHKAKVLNECQHVGWSGESDMSGKNACEKYECHAKRDAANLYLSEQHSHSNNYRVEQHNVCHRIVFGE